MKKPIQSVVIAIAAGAMFLPSSTLAERVHYLSGEKLNTANLVHVLRPKGPRPRGVGLKPPECSYLRQKLSRGIQLISQSDIASMSIEFDFNSSALRPESQKALDTLGQALKSEALKPCCFEIQGYTDSVGSGEYNQKLSEERANSVIDYLNAHEGIERDRMIPRGFGETRAIASNATEEGRQRNRRVQVLNLGYGALDTEN